MSPPRLSSQVPMMAAPGVLYPHRVPRHLPSPNPHQQKSNRETKADWEKFIPRILNDASKMSAKEILDNLKKAAEITKQNTGADFWLTDEGQS